MDLTLDVGKNITGLIQQLANQIGVTADKVFPWYVKQSMIEGYWFFGISILIALIGLSILICGITRKEKDDAKSIMTAISCMLIFLVIFVNCLGGADALGKIINPEYYAMKEIIYHIGKMTGKQ